MTGEGWDYRYNQDLFKLRDLALITVCYIGAARITEVVGGPVQITVRGEDMDMINKSDLISIEPVTVLDIEGKEIPAYKTTQLLKPLTKDQFVFDEKEIWLRDLPIIKQKFVKIGNRWTPIMRPRDYPLRVEIPFFKDQESIKPFTEILESYLETVPEGARVFKVGRNRAWNIINEYGYFPHYFRDMGLKFWKRFFKNDSFKLKRFSGHRRWTSLEKYMSEELF